MSVESAEPDEKKSITARVDEDFHRKVRIAAAKEGVSIAEYTRQALDDSIDE